MGNNVFVVSVIV